MLGGEYVINFVTSSYPVKDAKSLHRVHDCLSAFICEEISFKKCCEVIKNILGSIEPVEKIRRILQQQNREPLNDCYSPIDEKGAHRKNKSWTDEEDERLLAGILRNGTSKWGEIAMFVGNNRTRAQCSQRWNRCLNPSIIKDKWRLEEDQKLLFLVEKFGDHSWAKIAQSLESRTDVQCRYRYGLLKKRSIDIQAKLTKKYNKHVANNNNFSEFNKTNDVPVSSERTPIYNAEIPQNKSIDEKINVVVHPLLASPATDKEKENFDELWDDVFSEDCFSFTL